MSTQVNAGQRLRMASKSGALRLTSYDYDDENASMAATARPHDRDCDQLQKKHKLGSAARKQMRM